jgi:hypothetical protein
MLAMFSGGALVVAAARVAPIAAPQAAQKPEPVACTFAHPQYAGNCVETVTPEEKQTPVQACRVVLSCLNNAQCVKTYCQSTTIRGGWTLVSPKEKEKER